MSRTNDLLLFGVTRRLLDMSALVIAAQCASYFTFGISLSILSPIYILLLYGGCLLLLTGFGDDYLRLSFSNRALLKPVATVFAVFAVVIPGTIAIAMLIPEIGYPSERWLISWFAISVLLTSTARSATCLALDFLRRICPDRAKRVIIIGYGDTGRKLHRRVAQHGYLGYEVSGIYAESGQELKVPHSVEKLASLEELVNRIPAKEIDEIWIALAASSTEELKKIQSVLKKTLVDVRLFPDSGSPHMFAADLSVFLDLPALTVTCPKHHGLQYLTKSMLDRLLACIALFLLAPLMLVVAVVIKFTSPGPVLYKQIRHGLYGRPFVIYKFRSMKIHENGAHHGFAQARKNDSRVTRFGAFIRRTSIDELPQFINVLKGDMSIVGPRPHAIEHNEMYSNCIEDYMQRHRVKPGITGWAQINGLRGETDTLEKMAKRVQFDMQYIREWCIWLDVKIIVWTALRGWTGNNAY